MNPKAARYKQALATCRKAGMPEAEAKKLARRIALAAHSITAPPPTH